MRDLCFITQILGIKNHANVTKKQQPKQFFGSPTGRGSGCAFVFLFGMFFSGHADFHQSCGIPPGIPTMAGWNFPTMNESMYFLLQSWGKSPAIAMLLGKL